MVYRYNKKKKLLENKKKKTLIHGTTWVFSKGFVLSARSQI